MKTIFLMYLLIIPVCLQAQIEQYTRVLEPSVLVCQYECVKKVDTLGTDNDFAHREKDKPVLCLSFLLL
mgnify:CR=1 FL=1